MYMNDVPLECNATNLVSWQEPPRNANCRKKSYMAVMKLEKVMGDIRETIIRNAGNKASESSGGTKGLDSHIQGQHNLEFTKHTEQNVHKATGTTAPTGPDSPFTNLSSEACEMLEGATPIFASMVPTTGDFTRNVNTTVKQNLTSADIFNINAAVK